MGEGVRTIRLCPTSRHKFASIPQAAFVRIEMGSQSSNALTAHYTSASEIHTFSSPLPGLPLSSGTVDEKTSYLNALRSDVTQLQGEINNFLTKRMEDEKLNELGKNGSKRAKNEEREEAMYGEEDAEEEG